MIVRYEHYRDSKGEYRWTSYADAQHRASDVSRRLETIPGIGVIGATAHPDKHHGS